MPHCRVTAIRPRVLNTDRSRALTASSCATTTVIRRNICTSRILFWTGTHPSQPSTPRTKDASTKVSQTVNCDAELSNPTLTTGLTIPHFFYIQPMPVFTFIAKRRGREVASRYNTNCLSASEVTCHFAIRK